MEGAGGDREEEGNHIDLFWDSCLIINYKEEIYGWDFRGFII